MKEKLPLHKNHVKYQKYIISHPNYKNIPQPYPWVAAGNSENGKARKIWWLEKKKELKDKGIPISDHAELSPTCLVNHPTQKKNCKICGESWSLEYIYPNKNTLKTINIIFSKNYNLNNNLTILYILEKEFNLNKKDCFIKLNLIFENINSCKSLDEGLEFIKNNFVNKFSKKLSPGAMSNCPDRLDGFHDHCLKCRPSSDKGRHQSNLQKYGEDRRAYEYWSDGNWKKASWLMKEFNKHNLSPDHVGPISLGFCHRPSFNPMTKAENSAKGNRLTLNDFKQLIEEEKSEKIVSWHTVPLWNVIKKKIKNKNDISKLNKIMRKNMHIILLILYELHKAGFEKFLTTFLNPQYAYYSYKFTNFDKQTGKYIAQKIEGTKKQYRNNASRYIRKSFEYLKKYKNKKNRKLSNLAEKNINNYINAFRKNPKKETLLKIFQDNAKQLIDRYF